jgi:hypothetical protein
MLTTPGRFVARAARVGVLWTLCSGSGCGGAGAGARSIDAGAALDAVVEADGADGAGRDASREAVETSPDAAVDAWLADLADPEAPQQTADVADSAGAGDGGLQPIQVVGGAATGTWYDLTLVGTGLESYEGAVVSARIGQAGTGQPTPWRLGWGQTRIANGGFKMFFPKVLERDLYKHKTIHIDANNNGLCDVGDLVFGDASFAERDVILEVSPSSVALRPATTSGCSMLNEPWPR